MDNNILKQDINMDIHDNNKEFDIVKKCNYTKYIIIQILMFSNLVISSLAASDMFSKEINQQIDIISTVVSGITLIIVHLLTKGFTLQGTLEVTSKVLSNIKDDIDETHPDDANRISLLVKNMDKTKKILGKKSTITLYNENSTLIT